MNISLKIEGDAAMLKSLAAMGTQAKPAIVRWANWIGLEAQGAMRESLPQRFQMRGTSEQFRKAIVFQSATTGGKRDTQAILKVGADSPGGTRASATQRFGVMLARFEEDDTRSAPNQTYRNSQGGIIQGGFFIPANGLRSSTQNPSRSLYPTSIGAQIRSDPGGRVFFAKGTKSGSKAKGNGVSYFVTDKGIFRRRHSMFGSADVEAIWWFRKSIRTPARLGLWTTAQRVFDTRAIALGQQAIEETIFRASL